MIQVTTSGRRMGLGNPTKNSTISFRSFAPNRVHRSIPRAESQGDEGDRKGDRKFGREYYAGLLTQPLIDPEDGVRVRASDSVGRAVKLGLQTSAVLGLLLLAFMASNGLL